VAIVGRPNVGKSTLFNRLTHSRRSIVGDEPGITRDRIYGEYEWLGRQFPPGGHGRHCARRSRADSVEIYAQAKVALEEADALVLVVDARTELASPDYDLVKLLIRGGKPVFLAVNKVEGEAMAAEAENFRQLGHLRNVFPISSEHGLGIGELAGGHLRGDSCPRTDCGQEAEAVERGRRFLRPKRTRFMREVRSRRNPMPMSTRCIARMANSSSTRLRWPSSGGRTWASRRC
jgi:small GTP-binding protein